MTQPHAQCTVHTNFHQGTKQAHTRTRAHRLVRRLRVWLSSLCTIFTGLLFSRSLHLPMPLSLGTRNKKKQKNTMDLLRGRNMEIQYAAIMRGLRKCWYPWISHIYQRPRSSKNEKSNESRLWSSLTPQRMIPYAVYLE